MARHLRSRDRLAPLEPHAHYTQVTYNFPSGVVTNEQQLGDHTARRFWEQCNDSVGGQPPYPDSDLLIQKTGWKKFASLSGQAHYDSSGSSRKLNIYQGFSGSNVTSYGNATNVEPSTDWDYWKTKALANLNPNKPDVDLPVSLAELRDLPRMLKNIGDLLRLGKSGMPKDVVKTMAESHLNWQFGWAPLIKDVQDLLGFTDKINDRLDYLRKLDGGTIVKRRLGRLAFPSHLQTKFWFNNSETGLDKDALFVFDRSTTWVQDGWFSARVSLQTPLPKGDRAQRDLAASAALGLNISPATAWNLIPWTWLSDWFTNTGDIMDTTRNAIPYKVTHLNVMVRMDGRSTVTPTKLVPGLKATVGEGYYIEKARKVYLNPKPSFTFKPFIDGRQASILGALGIVSALRGDGRVARR